MPEGLSIDAISVRYPGASREAIKDISFEVQPGSFFVVAGASGSGKSSLLKAAAGLVDLSGGQISWAGERLKGPSMQLVAGHPQIKLVKQDFDLQEHMTVRENLKHTLRAFAEPYRSARIEELISLCRLDGLDERFPAQLSGGQRQRVAWAAVLADEPQLLLLDEPFSHLDRALKAELSSELQQIRTELAITIIMVTHDPAEALSLGEKIVLLKEGRLEMLDSPEKVWFEPVSVYAASFFGEANFLSRMTFSSLAMGLPNNGGEQWMLRPQFVQIHEGEAQVKLKVMSCQLMGPHYLVTLRVPDAPPLKAFAGRKYEDGVEVSVRLDTSRLHPVCNSIPVP